MKLTTLIAVSFAAATASGAGTPAPLGPLGGSASSLVVHPTSPGSLLVTEFTEGVLVTHDGGQAFVPANTGLPGGVTYRGLARDAVSSDTVYVIAGDQLFRSTTFGSSWSFFGLGDDQLRAVATSTAGVVLAITNDTVWRTADGGMQWTPVATGTLVSAVAFAPSDPMQAWVGTIDGVMKSTDGGQSFAPVPALAAWAQAIAVAPNDPNLVLVGTSSGVQRTTNGGGSFVPANAGLPPFANAELIAFASASDVWLGLLDGMWRSVDGGASWIDANAGFPEQPPIPTGIGLALDGNVYLSAEASGGGVWRAPGAPPWVHLAFAEESIHDVLVAGPNGWRAAGLANGVFAAPDGQPLAPTAWQFDFGSHTEVLVPDPTDPTRWLTGGVGSFIDNAQVVVLTGNGQAIQKTYEEFGAGRVLALAFDPFDPSHVIGGVAPAGFGAEGIIRSTDGGASFAGVAGTAGIGIRDVAFNHQQPNRIFALRTNHQPLVSTNGGQSWSTPGLAPWPGAGDPVFLEGDPFLGGILYRGATVDGLWRSTNGGASWQNLDATAMDLHSDLVAHPHFPGLVLWTNALGEVRLSGDAGATSIAIADFDAATTGIALDLADGAAVVGTNGASVWEIPAASPLVRLGAGTPGTGGFVPVHFMTNGLPQVGNPDWTIAANHLVGGATALFFVGLTQTSVPAVGGTFFVGPPFVVAGLPLPVTGAPGAPNAGVVALQTGVPNDPALVGLTIVSQFAVQDAAALGGFALTNGVRTTFLP